ncbi:hypothetical protein [Corynebacterium durum]|uniref:hypothetical protein n=1 Tax=Corynebacterium durum TaxID=61592 RepID=UPI0028E51651|nr:hypothetical protein [Corynebacterium durum]
MSGDALAATPIADPNDSLLGWTLQTELSLNQRFKDITMFAQSDMSADELELIDRFYGTFLSRQLAAGAQLDTLLDNTPYLAVTTLVSRAARMVDPESFFAEYIGGLELHPTPEWVDTVQQKTLDLLVQVGLWVPKGDQPTVEVLALHAGVTGSEVAALLELMDSLDSDDAEVPLDALPAETMPVTAAVAQWGVDTLKPVVDKVAAFRAFTQAHPHNWQELEPPELPALVREAVAAELRERPVGTQDRATAVGIATREARPRLIIDAARRKVCLRLPEQILPEGAEEIHWRVNLDGTTKIYRTGRPWGETGPFAESLDVAIERQVRELTVTDSTTGTTWVIPVVDSDDPVLVFSAKGQNLTDKVSLHYAELLVLCPSDATLVDVVAGAGIPVTDTFDIEGWAGWVCRRIDAHAAASLQVVRPDQKPSIVQPVRCIDPRRRVTFRDPDAPVPNLLSYAGLPVYAQSLLAEFSPTVSGQPETWYLSISSFGGIGQAGEEVAPAEPLEIPAEGGVFDVFDPDAYDAPWVGEYLIRLRGPRNESFRHEFAIVEGMHAVTEIAGPCRSFRIPARGGLSEAALLVRSGAKPFDVSPKEVMVPADEAGANVVVSTDEGDQMPLRFIPPRLRFEVPLVTEPAMWRTTRLVCTPRQCDADGVVRIRATGELGTPTMTVRNHHGAPLRTVKLTTVDGVTYTAPMAALAASINVINSGRLELEWTDHRSDKRVSVNVADVEAAPHATGCRIEDGALVYEQPAAGRNIAAWVWPATAPWVGGRTVRGQLPETLLDAGPLIVQLHSADSFNVLWPPLVPSADAFIAEQPGFYHDPNPALAELSAFLAGEREDAPSNPDIMPILWDYLDGWGSVEASSLESRKAVMEAMAAYPSAALKGLSVSLVPVEKQPGRVIASGLVHGVFNDAKDVTEIHRTAWIGTLQLLGQLPAQYAAAEVGEGRAALRDTVSKLEQVAGKRLVEALATGRDATLDTACVDQSIVHIAHMEPAQQDTLIEMLFSQAEIVPGPIMDDSARLLAVFETFKQRAALNELLSDQALIATAVSLLRALRGANRQLYASARIRFDKLDGVDTDDRSNIWTLAPVISLVFALTARMRAHELIGKSKLLTEARTGWSALADVVPDLVTSDLISAEAMVLAVKYPGIGG